jgi:hypothetical protein
MGLVRIQIPRQIGGKTAENRNATPAKEKFTLWK